MRIFDVSPHICYNIITDIVSQIWGFRQKGVHMTFVRNKKEKNEVSIIEWYIAIYVRLSKEDGDKLESDSIQNQKGIIEQHIKYLQGQGEIIASVEIYSDDGYSGGNFERPN